MSTNCPHCPHCGRDLVEGDGIMYLPHDDNGETEMTCHCCRETFWIRTTVRLSWETFPTEEEFEMS
jgi:hypothetical protein